MALDDRTEQLLNEILETQRAHLEEYKRVTACHLLHALDSEPTPDAKDVGMIICFLVEPSHRGRGIARHLLDAACDALRRQGLRIAEANPRTATTSAAGNHFGPLSLYLSAGFVVHREDEDGSVHVRRML